MTASRMSKRNESVKFGQGHNAFLLVGVGSGNDRDAIMRAAVGRALSTRKEIAAPRKVEQAGIPASGVCSFGKFRNIVGMVLFARAFLRNRPRLKAPSEKRTLSPLEGAMSAKPTEGGVTFPGPRSAVEMEETGEHVRQ